MRLHGDFFQRIVYPNPLSLYAIVSHLSTFLTKKIKGVNKPPCMRVGTKPTINNLAVEFATLLSIICNKNAFVNENKDSLKQKDENKKNA